MLALFALTIAACALVAAGASAKVVLGNNGRLVGIQFRSHGTTSLHSAARPSNTAGADNGLLSYNGGPVLHSSKPYLIFWTGSSGSISTTSENLLARYFTDVAAVGGASTNVYGVHRQYTDGSGFADYHQTFSSGTQAFADTDPYPTSGRGNCPITAGGPTVAPPAYSTCLTDAQLQTEVGSFIAAHSLPKGTGPDAPIYFVVTPGDVSICYDNLNCTTNSFCAYHSSFTSGSNVLYASIPMFFNGASPIQNPKACQSDNHSALQKPNGDLADVAVGFMSHEDNETITDPLGTGWWDSTGSGNENGDNCSFYGATADPAHGASPTAYAPTLGGTASAGTLFDQVINGHDYYTQTEWSNGGLQCLAQPSPTALSAAFTAPANTPGVPITFDPSTSTSTFPLSSHTWSFGDGAGAFHAGSTLSSTSHSYASIGAYTGSLTLVDNRGNIATATNQVDVGNRPTAAFTPTPTSVDENSPVSFDAVGSTPGSGDSIANYTWNFGDNSPAGSGVSTQHSYPRPGTYTVTLTVTGANSLTDSTTRQVTVIAVPAIAAFTASPASTYENSPITFDASSSTPNHGGSILASTWSFGDGSSGSGSSVQHSYASAGTYTVAVSVTGSDGIASTASHQVVVNHRSPVAQFVLRTPNPGTGQSLSFDASSSAATGAIASYRWNFGDGTAITSSSAIAAHAFRGAGSHTITLIVTDSSGATATLTRTILVRVSGRISAARVHRHGRVVTLLVTVNQAGQVTVGDAHQRALRATTLRFRILLSSSQRRRLARGQAVRLRLRVGFVPVTGSAQSRTVRATLH